MKVHLYLLIVLFFVSCRNGDSTQEKLKIENDSLKREIKQLNAHNELNEKPNQNTLVTIANTNVQEITSNFNNQKYQIKISYPKSYFKNSTKKYPVLYAIDAETNFGGVSYIVQRLIKDKLIPEIIVVGIAYNTDYKNFYRLRSRDLTPVEDKKLKMGNHDVDPTGGAPQFSNFLEFELFPFIEKEFRTIKGDRAIYGHSYGGLFGTYLLLNKSNLFNRYLLLGPSLWFKDKLMVKQASKKRPNFEKNIKVYMGSGEEEFRIDDFQAEFVNALRAKNIEKLDLKSEIIKNETHRTIFGVGFTNGLRYIYPEK